MTRAPRLTGREMVRALKRLGWRKIVQQGSHVHLVHGERNGKVTVPIHAGETLDPKLLGSILRQAGITVDELQAAL